MNRCDDNGNALHIEIQRFHIALPAMLNNEIASEKKLLSMHASLALLKFIDYTSSIIPIKSKHSFNIKNGKIAKANRSGTGLNRKQF